MLIVNLPTKRIANVVSVVITALTLAAIFSEPVNAHEIPSDVVIHAFVKPDGNELNLLLRVPLSAMRDVDFPIFGPGYLDIENADEALRDAAEIWLTNFIAIYESGDLLQNPVLAAARISLPSDRSFTSYELAQKLLAGPRLANSQELYRQQALMDVFVQYPIHSDVADFSIEPDFARLGLRTTTVLRFLPPGKSERIFELSGSPGLVDLDPRWHNAFLRFVRIGFGHIIGGIDHLLFLLCLIIPFRRVRPLVVIVSSFTVAHSITLLSSAFGFVPDVGWFPPLIETLIAMSIVYMAIENILGGHLERRWLIAFGFGLVHGFGFSFALSQSLQFAGTHLLTALLAFNFGVELGQLAVILGVLPLINYLFRSARAKRLGTIILSALLAHSGWHWMSDRAADLSLYSYSWPALNAASLASLMRLTMFVLIVGSALWLMYSVYKKLLMTDREPH